MKLTNMASTDDEQAETPEPAEAEYHEPKYPWGLKLTLNEESLAKLGIETLPKAGAEVTIQAKASVCGVSQYERDTGEANRAVDLQITDLGISSGQSKSDAEIMYPNK